VLSVVYQVTVNYINLLSCPRATSANQPFIGRNECLQTREWVKKWNRNDDYSKSCRNN
jgi:hypothetical protein